MVGVKGKGSSETPRQVVRIFPKLFSQVLILKGMREQSINYAYTYGWKYVAKVFTRNTILTINKFTHSLRSKS